MINEFQTIRINRAVYEIIDSIQNLRIEDSFAYSDNKQIKFSGHGEARKYIGSYTNDELNKFFGYDQWGGAQTDVTGKRIEYPEITKNCFFSKSNFMRYLYDAKYAYNSPWIYKEDISFLYNDRVNIVKNLSQEVISFTIHDVSDLIHHQQNRAYIRSDDDIWKTWRNIILPQISYLSILKLRHKKSNQIFFYFRIFIDDEFRTIRHPNSTRHRFVHNVHLKIYSNSEPYRTGQSEFRENVIKHMPQCPFTLISDTELLVASHIKPYAHSSQFEAYHHLNGLSLTPTYDKLFDRGFITFTDQGELICCAQLYPESWEKLGIKPNAKKVLDIKPQGREKYLEYHRNFVFQDNIDDFL